MMLDFVFFFNSILLGAGLAMDAFSVSLANGLGEPEMRGLKTFGIAGVFAIFQAIMPLTGWLCVHTATQMFASFGKFIPWIAMILLSFIGGKMIYEGISCNNEYTCQLNRLGLLSLLLQGVATSIDALSVGFTIAEYNFAEALVSVIIIAIVTFGICYLGLYIGKHAGTRLSGKAGILGGTILIFIGLEILVTSFF